MVLSTIKRLSYINHVSAGAGTPTLLGIVSETTVVQIGLVVEVGGSITILAVSNG